MGNRTTIQIVAELAGVSWGTVDRVLNDRPHVNEEVRRRVLEAMRKLGYISPREVYRRQADAALRLRTLGVLLPNWEGQFRIKVTEGVRQACEELEESKVRVLVHRCETDLPQEAVELLEAMKAEGFAVCAVNDPAIQGWIAASVEKGIPCVTFNSDLPESGRLCFVGQNIRQAGRVAAGLLFKCIDRQGPILATASGYGFRERLAELGFPAEQIVVRETYNDYETTLRVVSESLENWPDLRGVYMANLSVSGCCAAIQRAGRTGKVHVVCHDINETVRKLIHSGAADFTIPQDLTRQSCPLAAIVGSSAKKRPLESGQFQGQINILCMENLEGQ